MRGMLHRPVIVFALGVLAGYVFSSQVSKVPGVSKLPKA